MNAFEDPAAFLSRTKLLLAVIGLLLRRSMALENLGIFSPLPSMVAEKKPQQVLVSGDGTWCTQSTIHIGHQIPTVCDQQQNVKPPVTSKVATQVCQLHPDLVWIADPIHQYSGST